MEKKVQQETTSHSNSRGEKTGKGLNITPEDLSALKSGDHTAFKKVYLVWRSPILNMLLRLTASREEAEDIAQEVFTKLWQNRGNIDPDKRINTYLYLAARHSAIDYFRRKKLSGDYMNALDWDDTDSASSDSIVIEKEIELLKEIALARMPEYRRNIYNLSYGEGLSNEEIAQRLGITRETVYTQLSVARKQLRELVRMAVILFFLQ